MSEWKQYKLGNIADVKGGKRLPKGELLVDYETAHPYIRVTDFGKKWIKKDGLQFVLPEIQKSISRYTVNGGDVILSIVGSIGFTARVSSELDGANLTENCVKFISKEQIINDDFLYYFLSSNLGQDEISQRTVGSTQPKLPLYNIKDINIHLPPLPEQTAIAEVLSSLDDKIDLLHRQNKTLEQLAETLFRQWFVEEAEESWEEGKLEDFINVKYGKDHKKVMDGNIPVYGSGGIMRYGDKSLYDKESILIPRK
jgi:type I restriction enzyme S subunit